MSLSWSRIVLSGAVVLTVVGVGVVSAPAEAAHSTSSGVRCTIVGTAGDDTLVGTPGRDVICGLGGNDVIVGRGGDDLVDAGGGNDRVSGGAGHDVLIGGSGKDRLTGGDQGDRIAGGSGNDFLISGKGPDHVDGGRGDNLCLVDGHDVSRRCHYDEEAPVVVTARASVSAVDVTNASAVVTVRAHLTDDTGVASVFTYLNGPENTAVSFGGPSEPEAGVLHLVRNGWWKTTITVPRYTVAGPLSATVYVDDRVGRSTSADFDNLVQVADADPDTVAPDVSLVSVTPTPVDVRQKAQDVRIRFHAVDAQSGVERLSVCLTVPDPPTPAFDKPSFHSATCDDAAPRTTGTARDGQWTASVTLPRRATSGTYEVLVYGYDRAGNVRQWLAPYDYAVFVDGHWSGAPASPLPGGGDVQVLGAPADQTPARVTGVTASRTHLDTLQKDARFGVNVHAKDAAGPGEGVTSVVAWLEPDTDLASNPQFSQVTLTRSSGTNRDGRWTGHLDVPQGTPPGTYHLVVVVVDRAHAAEYTDPGHTDGLNNVGLPGMPVITVDDTQP